MGHDLIKIDVEPLTIRLRRGRFLQISEAAPKDGYTQRFRIAIPAQVREWFLPGKQYSIGSWRVVAADFLKISLSLVSQGFG